MTTPQALDATMAPLFARDDNSVESFRIILRTYLDSGKLGLDLDLVRFAKQIGQTERTVRGWYTGSIPDPALRRKVVLKIKQYVAAPPLDDAPTAA
jgi:hypothetical protein